MKESIVSAYVEINIKPKQKIYFKNWGFLFLL